MFTKLRPAVVVACGIWLGLVGSASAAEEASQEATFELVNIDAKSAATVVRTIADVRNLTLVDEQTIAIRDLPERLALATAVVEMADTPPGETPDGERLSVGDGTVVTSVVLEHVSAKDVMVALRTQVQLAKLATMGERRVILRDTEAQIEAALELIRKLEGSGSS